MISNELEEEIEKRTLIIERILEQASKENIGENNKIKDRNLKNYSSINALYNNPIELQKIFKDFFEDMIQLYGKFYSKEERKFKLCERIKKFYMDVFTKQRAVALVNILQPINERVYRSEGIQSLIFSTEELLKGFDSEIVKLDGFTEIEVKTLFWINKLAKLSDYREVDRLKGKPILCNSDENYYKARKRVEILGNFEGLNAKDVEKIEEKFNTRYKEIFGVTIEDDYSTLADLKSMKNYIYGVKNLLAVDLVNRYFTELKKGKQLSGVQAMGITKNTSGFSYTQGGNMAIIRLKGYTFNIYLHLPSMLYDSVVEEGKFGDLRMEVPNQIHFQYQPDRVIPTNVICKVKQGSRRHKLIKEELKAKPNNIILRQAESQISIVNLKPKDKEKWSYENVR